MDPTLVITVFLFAGAGLIAFFLTRRHARRQIDALSRELSEARGALMSAKAGFAARDEELRVRIGEAREEVNQSSQRLVKLADELKATLEEKGQLQSTASRLEEVKEALLERDGRIDSLNAQIVSLERERAEAVKDAQAADRRATEFLTNERDAHTEIMKAEDDQIARLDEFIAHAREVLTTEFKALSADVIRDASGQLIKATDELIEKHGKQTSSEVKLHRQEIETLLKPVEETIKRLDKHVEDSNLSRANAEVLLNDRIEQLNSASESLSCALRKPVVRGSWGEMVLEDALEAAGLVADIDFVLQHTTEREDGRKRTDAIVNMPKGRKLIIDSKNLMESYIALTNADNEAQRSFLAENHSRLLKAHIKALWAKEYWTRYEGLDFVFLFIPHDGMYHAAIRDEAELLREANEKRVFICNPMTLIPLLKAMRYVLDQDRVNKSAEEIRRVGAELYSEVTRFATHMATIGDRLRSTVKAYNEAIPGLDRFIVAKSRKLKQLGSGRGAEAELPDSIEMEPRPFSSEELRGLDIALKEGEEAGETASTPGNNCSDGIEQLSLVSQNRL